MEPAIAEQCKSTACLRLSGAEGLMLERFSTKNTYNYTPKITTNPIFYTTFIVDCLVGRRL